MQAQFQPDRLKKIRENLGITMAEASRRLNLSKIGYCRYEYGERTPSIQTIEVIAQCFTTSVDYLTGLTDDPTPNQIIIEKKTSPDLFTLIETCKDADTNQIAKLLKYYKGMNQK